MTDYSSELHVVSDLQEFELSPVWQDPAERGAAIRTPRQIYDDIKATYGDDSPIIRPWKTFYKV